MRREKFIEFMHHPEKVGADDLQELEALVARYPYFQAARMLYLKVLYLQAGSRFRHELRTSTVHITDRKHLLHYLNQLPGNHLHVMNLAPNDAPQADMLPDAEKATANTEAFRGEYSMQPVISSQIEDDEGIVSLNIEAPHATQKEGTPTRPETTTARPKPERQLSSDPVPMDLDIEEAETTDAPLETPEILATDYYFSEEEEATLPEEPIRTKTKKNQLIDNFIENNPGMPKSVDTTTEMRDLSQENPYLKEELFSETLAKIYVKQKLYEKAITTYVKLSLKYPEKSVYFAERIERIKRNINNQE